MKKIIVACFFTLAFSFFTSAQDRVEESTSSHNQLNWEGSFKKAQKLAKAQEKPLLIFFTGSDWCGPCKMLVTDFFDSEKFKEIAAEEFILYEADKPRNNDLITEAQKEDNAKLRTKYKVNSYPTIIILDSKGNEIGRKKSYNLMRDTSYHYQFLEETLNKIK